MKQVKTEIKNKLKKGVESFNKKNIKFIKEGISDEKSNKIW